jgi:hypothetical protein
VKKWYSLLLLVIVMACCYVWTRTDRVADVDDIYPRYVLGTGEELGKDKGKGNVIALSPYLHTYDFSSEIAYFNMLHYYLDFAARRNMLRSSTIVVLPEYIGTWLVAVNEKKSIYSDTSLEHAMKMLAYSNPFEFISAEFRSHSKNKKTEALFRMKSAAMLQIYQHTFSRLAKEFKISIVAGSIVLPDPSVESGIMKIDQKGRLYNVSAVFDTLGNVLSPLTKKRFLVDEEKSFTAASNENETPIYKMPAGNLAILICADSWYPSVYSSLKDKKIDILAVPAFVEGENNWYRPWKGYTSSSAPADIDKTDIGKLTEHDAWMKYSAKRTLGVDSLKAAAYVFLHGDLWNIGSEGNTIITSSKYVKPFFIPSVYEAKPTENKTGALINVWLE